MGKVLKVLAVVVAIAVIVFAPQLIPQLIGSALIASAVTAAVVVAAGVALSVLLAPRPSTQTATPSVFRQSIANSFIVYGKRRVGGLLVFFHSKKHTDKKHYRYFAIAVAGHRCKRVVQWMLNDDVVTVDGSGMVTSGPYAGACWLWFQRGLASETANPTFVAECGGKWTANHKGNGVAAIYAKFRMNDDVIEAGMPNMTAIIEGRDEIRDPRDDSSGYTDNAALVFYDFMEMPREEGGFGAYEDEIPDDGWISAQANVCDEVVEGEARYALDGVITTGAAPSEVRDALVQNCAGSYTYSEGKHLLRVGYWVPPSERLSEGALSGGIKVSPFLPNDAAANEIQGTFYDPAQNYQPQPFTTQTTSPAPVDVRQLDLDLPFVTSRYRGERIATIMLRRAACEKTVAWPMNIEGLKTAALDVVQLGTERYGLSNYAFVVASWTITADFGVALTLREENAEIYDGPTPTTPASVDTIDVPTRLLTSTELQNLIRVTYPTGVVLTGQEVGGDGQLVIGDHHYEWPGYGTIGPVTGTTLTGLTPGTTVFPYADVEDAADPAPAFGATTVYADALNSAANPFRIYLNQAVELPGVGDPDSGGTPGGGGFGGGYGNVIP